MNRANEMAKSSGGLHRWRPPPNQDRRQLCGGQYQTHKLTNHRHRGDQHDELTKVCLGNKALKFGAISIGRIPRSPRPGLRSRR